MTWPLTPPDRLEYLQIEVTTQCNLRCPQCMRTLSLAKGTWTDAHMPRDLFERIVESVPACDRLVVQGVGEPSLHPELPELISRARNAGKFGEIFLYTNALARDAGYYEGLVEAGLSYFVVSADSFTPGVAARCRPGGDVGELADRIRALAAKGHCRVSITLGKANLDDLPRTLEALGGIGPMIVSVQPLTDYAGMLFPDRSPSLELDSGDLAVYEAVRADCLGRFPRLRMEDDGMRLIAARSGASAGNPGVCPRPFTSPYVTVEGYLTPCCLIYDPDVYGRTALGGQTFAKAWTSPPVSSWLAGSMRRTPGVCAGCVLLPRAGA